MAEQQTLFPTLHHLENSQSFRVLVALEELAAAKGVKYDLKIYGRISDYKPAIKTFYPMAKSPTLSIHDRNENLSTQIYQDPNHPGVLTESRLILKFLSDTFGGDLWRIEDPQDQRQEEFVAEFVNNTLGQKLGFCLMLELIPPQLPIGLNQLVAFMVRPIVNVFMVDVTASIEILEAMLTSQKPWFSGTKMGLADLNVIWGMDVCVQRGYIDLDKFPHLKRWHETITARPACKRALEKGGKYDLVGFL